MPLVQMAMSVKAAGLVTAMQTEFGGQVYEMKFKNKKWSDQLQWRMNGAAAIRFLRAIRPFLMLKGAQADLAFRLDTMRLECGWTKDTKKKAEQMKQEMHSLNKKGPTAPSAGEGWYEPTPDLFGTLNRFSGRWPRSGLMRAGIVYELPTLAPTTGGTGGGALPIWQTPVADDSVDWAAGKFNSRGEPKLSAQAKMWPTPTVGDSRNSANATAGRIGPSNAHAGVTLVDATRMWPSPKASDGTNGGLVSEAKANRDRVGTLQEAISQRMWPTPTTRDYRSDQASEEWTTAREADTRGKTLPFMAGGTLNPTWVEWLMAWPLGWTASKPSATARSRCKRPTPLPR